LIVEADRRAGVRVGRTHFTVDFIASNGGHCYSPVAVYCRTGAYRSQGLIIVCNGNCGALGAGYYLDWKVQAWGS
jgi:hypothetical protein